MTSEPRVLSERYRVDGLIGRGGMATVYQGYDLTLGRDVAIKILDPELARDPGFRTRFRLEAQAASRMSHPTIVRVFDAGEDAESLPDGTTQPVPYIVMELVHGKLLKQIIDEGPVEPERAVTYADGILEALEYSHRAGVVHRDIKPGNVMVTEADQIKVMDFGIARAVSDSSSTVAETTAILGTAAYFSPEQAKGDPVDSRADLYSTGVVLYEMLTGRQPFRGDSAVAVAYQHVSETPENPSELIESLPRSLDVVVLRALAKDPYQRYQDAASFRAALTHALTGKAPTRRQLGTLTSELYGPNPRQAQETARSLRQLSSDTTMRRTQSGPPAAWIWAGVAILAVLLISVLFWVLTLPRGDDPVPSNARIVPDLTGMTYERASEELLAEDLVPVQVERPSSEVAEGNVIRTDPVAGTSVGIQHEITVYVSMGQEMSTVPTVVGLSQDAASAALEQAGLTLGTVIARNDASLSAGTVISSNPDAETSVPAGSTVDLVVATGRVVINDVTGYTVEAATRELEAADTQLTVETQGDASCPASTPPVVTAQSLAPGEVPVHSTITLTYCSG
ncbi:Stk1 family PASTA domain-containing Ser/Thr kinase [Microbacterium sediminicola]|uniref:non-specific serine/threonine protein kinase n=1 Tax=Microbacterium sediminicola TaxID=415210 RepID=A0ABP4UGH8_9MICO